MTTLVDEIKKLLAGKKPEEKSQMWTQILADRELYDSIRKAGIDVTPTETSERGVQRPYGVLSKVFKVDLVDLITEITKISEITSIKDIDNIELISELGDGTRALKIVVQQPPSGFEPAGIYFVRDTLQKTPNALITEYLKQGCILSSNTIVSDPCGMMVSYEGGYAAMALIENAGAGEVALAKACLDEFVLLQKIDGSWSQQYRPERLADGTHTEQENRQVDSGASVLAHAMTNYDASIGAGSVIYKEVVRKAFSFLREAQYNHTIAHGSSLLCSQRLDNVWNTGALLADCAEALLSALAALDQYGTALTTSAGYSIKTFANDLAYSIATVGWTGGANDGYYRTEYPAGTTILGLTPPITQGVSFTQGLCAMAIYLWGISAHQTSGDYSAQAELALDWITALAQGKWGGFYYAPVATGYGTYYDEFPAYTAQVIRAYDAVNAAKYENPKARAISFIRSCALTKGEVFNCVHPNGRVEQGEKEENAEGTMEFRCLNTALALLAIPNDVVDGHLTVIAEQSDETLFKATVTQAEKDRTVTGTVTAEQATRTSLKVQTEREDVTLLRGVASPNAAGVQIVAANGTEKIKVYDAEYEALVDGLHCFYFGTSTVLTTRGILSRSTKGVNSKTFLQPAIGNAGDALYLYSANGETNMPYDLRYVQE